MSFVQPAGEESKLALNISLEHKKTRSHVVALLVFSTDSSVIAVRAPFHPTLWVFIPAENFARSNKPSSECSYILIVPRIYMQQ